MKDLKALALLIALTFIASSTHAQVCVDKERYLDLEYRCVDPSLADSILLGNVRVSEQGKQKQVILHDEKRGDIVLVLTAGLVQAIDESPAESFEVEGVFFSESDFAVKSIRPIE